MKTRSTALAVLLALSGCADGTPADRKPHGDAPAAATDDAASKTSRSRDHRGALATDEAPITARVKNAPRPFHRNRRGSTTRATEQVVVRHPRAGVFVFSQRGFEELCQGAACDRARLPRRQEMDSTVRRTRHRATVTTVARSGDRELRTVTVYGPRTASINELAFHFSYNGVRFGRSYSPAPAVVALRLPLMEGAVWSGSWRAETSGSYRSSVGKSETVVVGNRQIRAWRIDTLTALRGELEGSLHIETWVDPATNSVIAMSGTMDVRSTFGRYRSNFEARLERGPGYP